MSAGKILIVGTQGQRVTSGPGTFMRYLCESIDEGALDAEILYPHTSKGTPYADRGFVRFCKWASPFYNRFLGSWIIVAFFVYLYLRWDSRYRRYESIWFADRYSALFCVLDPEVRAKSFVMVNDDSRIQRWHEKKVNHDCDLRSILPRWSAAFFYSSERFIAQHAARVVSNSNYLNEILKKEYQLDGKVMFRLYKAVDLQAFPPREGSPFSKLPYEVLFIKNEWHRGGLDTLIQALSRLPNYDFTLRVVGIASLQEQAKIQQIAEDCSYKGELILDGFVDRDKIPGLVRGADFLCVPSRKEALGVAFLEALASGTPVVASDVGGIPEVLNGGRAGWMVTPSNPDALRDTIMDLIEQVDCRKEKVMDGLKHVATFSKERMTHEIIQASNNLTLAISGAAAGLSEET